MWRTSHLPYNEVSLRPQLHLAFHEPAGLRFPSARDPRHEVVEHFPQNRGIGISEMFAQISQFVGHPLRFCVDVHRTGESAGLRQLGRYAVPLPLDQSQFLDQFHGVNGADRSDQSGDFPFQVRGPLLQSLYIAVIGLNFTLQLPLDLLD
jgi:hypothetical protein